MNNLLIITRSRRTVLQSASQHNLTKLHITGGPGSSVGIVTEQGLNGPGSNPSGDEIFRPSRLTLEPTQPPVQWVQDLSRGQRRPGRGADPQPIQCRGPRRSTAIPLLTLRAFVDYKIVKPTYKSQAAKKVPDVLKFLFEQQFNEQHQR